jgi:hypothetical protein
MNTPAHFRFLLDSVEFTARRTDAVLYDESHHFWDDIIDTWERRDEKANYWLFCTRWLREEVLKVMQRGSPRALLGILSVLRPHDVPPPSASHQPSAAMKRRIVSMLLPILMAELVVRVRNAAADRLGPYSAKAAVFHPEDH